MKDWMKAIAVAGALAVTTGGVVWAQSISMVGGHSTVPDTIQVERFSVSGLGNVASALIDAQLKYGKVRSQSDAIMMAVLSQYPLGKMVDAYQWRSQDGYQTALVLAVQLDKPLPEGMDNDMVRQVLLQGLNDKVWMVANDTIAQTIATQMAKATANGKSSKLNVSVRLEDQAPLASVPGLPYASVATHTRVTIDINGFQLHPYIAAAAVNTPGRPVVYLMITSDVERNTFQPAFDEFVRNLR